MARKKNSNFMHYLVMGAGFAAGAAVVSVAITGLTIGVNEVYKAISKTTGGQPAVNGAAANGAFPQDGYTV